MSTKSKQRKQKKNASTSQSFIDSGSGRRNRWIDSYDNDEEEQGIEEQQIRNYIQTQWDEIHQAIDETNADLLYTLLPPVNLYNTKKKYWYCDLHWSEEPQGESILLRAVELQHIDCIKVILDKIQSKDLPPSIIDYSIWRPSHRTPLLMACEKGNLDIVQMLFERDGRLSFRTRAFSIAFEHGHEQIMNYLVTKCNLKNYENHHRTALDCVISRGYIETAKLLIHYGDTHRRNRDGFSPMMLAAHHDLTPLVDLLFQRLPLQEALDELMLLACHYIIHGDTQNRQKAFDLFVRGLTEGEPLENSVSHEAYEHCQECQTVDELKSIWDDENALRMYSLVVSERILLRLGDVDALLELIDRQYNLYRNNRLYHRALQLRIHVYHLAMNYQFDHGLWLQWYRVFRDGMMRDIDIVWNETKTIPIEWIELISACVFENEKFYDSFQIFHLLETIVHMIHLVTTKSHERRSLFIIARRAMRHDTMGNSLLVVYITYIVSNSFTAYIPVYNVSALSAIELMIYCGANVNGVTLNHWTPNRPLHAIAKCRDIDIAKPIIELLLAHGAHTDCIDFEGKFPQDYTEEPATKELVSPTRKLSLKCRCAQIIVSKNIDYQTHLPAHLLDFIRLHDKPETEPKKRFAISGWW